MQASDRFGTPKRAHLQTPDVAFRASSGAGVAQGMRPLPPFGATRPQARII